MRAAKWSQLTLAQQTKFGNGCGPAFAVKFITKYLTGWFFIASCRHHDFGYYVGGGAVLKIKADLKFLNAMFGDAVTGFQSERRDNMLKRVFNLLYRLTIALFFYVVVMTWGWTPRNFTKFGAWNYRKQPLADIKQIIKDKKL